MWLFGGIEQLMLMSTQGTPLLLYGAEASVHKVTKGGLRRLVRAISACTLMRGMNRYSHTIYLSTR